MPYTDRKSNSFGTPIWEKIFERLEKEGTIQGKDGGNYYTTIPGISKYLKLRKTKRNEPVFLVLQWIIVIAAIVSAVYAILTYYGC